MATATLEFDAPQGLTLTAQLFALGADVELIAAACTERTNDKGSYTCSIVDIASGSYRLRIKNAGNVTIARGKLQHTNSAVTEYPMNVDWGSLLRPDSTVNLSGTTVGALSTTERDAIAAALLDLSNGIETGVTLRQAQRAVAAIIAGIVSGAGTGTEVFKGIGQASGGTTRATVTVDASGNRSAVSLP